MSRHVGRPVARGIAVLAVAVASVSCSEASEVAQQSFVSTDGERLIVATDLPSPGFWADGADEPGAEPAGFEHELAALLAERFGLGLVVVDVPFADIVEGRLGGADLAIAQISITDDRDDVIAFSLPYYRTDSAVVTRRDLDLVDLKTAREQRWVAEAGSTQDDVIADEIRPDIEHVTADSALDAVRLVLDGSADAALLDLPTAFAVTRSLDPDGDQVTVTASLPTDERYAIALANDAPAGNLESVDAAIRALEAAGTLNDLVDEWLLPLYGADPDDLPVIRIR